MIWKTGKIKVFYKPSLDRGGKFQSPYFIRFLRDHHGSAPFAHAFEWCSGPGLIGFSLLAKGIVKKITFGDVNSAAMASVKKTVRENRLEDRVNFYHSDNFTNVPKHEKFDLVVGNPPNYCRPNPKHPLFARLRQDPRPNDPNWKIHREFYSQVQEYLAPHAWIVVSEVEAESKNVFFGPPNLPTYDLRKRPPLSDFRIMIRKAGLKYVGNFPYRSGPAESALSFVVSRRARGSRT
jgi:16S rRNA G966 N2-methylase RsmD